MAKRITARDQSPRPSVQDEVHLAVGHAVRRGRSCNQPELGAARGVPLRRGLSGYADFPTDPREVLGADRPAGRSQQRRALVLGCLVLRLAHTFESDAAGACGE